MKIADLQVDGFGVWKGLTVDDFDDGMTVFYGQNEAGKTTLMHFVRSMLFGFSEFRRDRYVPPVYGGLAGGSMAVSSPLGGFEIQRHVDHNRLSDPTGDLAVTDAADGSVHGRAQLGNILSDIDESIFNNVFAIGLREIQELGTLNSTAAAEHLYKLTSGLDRVSLVDVMRDLQKRREAIWSKDSDTQSRMTAALRRRRELSLEIEELTTRSRRWSKIAMQTTDVGRQLDDVAEQIRSRQNRGRVIELAMQIGDRWQARQVLDRQLEDLGPLPDPRDLEIGRLDDFNEKIEQYQQKFQNVLTQRREIKREALNLPINRHLWAQTPKIQALNEHLPWIESLQRQADRLRGEINGIQKQLGGELSGLGSQLKLTEKDVQDLSNRGLINLRAAAKRMVDETDKQAQLQEKVEEAEFELSQHTDRLQSAQTAADGTESAPMEDVSKLVGKLRRRVELENKIDNLDRARRDLERELDDVVGEQVLPVGKLSIVGMFVIGGVVLLGVGTLATFFNNSPLGPGMQNVGILMIFMSFVCGFLAMALKQHWDRVARDEFNDYQHQFDLLRQQTRKAKIERDEIDAQLPRKTGSSWESQLRDAEGRLASLEDIVPIENRIRSGKRQLDAARHDMERQMIEVEAAEARWREALRSMGLPETLSPNNLGDVTQRTEKIHAYQSRLEQFATELQERDQEMANLNRKIDAVLEETGLETAANASASQRLQDLTTALAEQSRLVGRRKELATRFRGMRSKLSRLEQEIDKLRGEKQRLLAKVGARDEEEFRELNGKLAQRRKLADKRLNLSEQIAAALGTQVTEEEIDAQLESYGRGGLEKQWEAVQAELDDLRERQTRLHQQRGELLQEVKILGEDDRLDEARLELAAVEEELRQLRETWQVLACTTNILESIRENYEAQRQPETLREASNFLSRLTSGHYVRIWTRLVGEELLVDNSDGETLSVEHLSRGTREAVYLALRLALVGAYARRGAILPMVLDDVLVNFDSQRARAAATVLRDFANTGYQILMFTCHDHIRDMFHDLDVRVRILPHHKDVLETNAIPVDYHPLERPASPTVAEPVVLESVAVEPEPQYLGDVTLVPDLDLDIDVDEHDPELDYELAQIRNDLGNSPPASTEQTHQLRRA